MAEQKLLSRARLAKVAGVPEDVVAFWFTKDLLQSSETRARKHRRFDGLEVKFAILLREMRTYGMNIYVMQDAMELFRSAVATYELVGPGPEMREPIPAGRADLWILGKAIFEADETIALFVNDEGKMRVSIAPGDNPPAASFLTLCLWRLFDIEWFEFEE